MVMTGAQKLLQRPFADAGMEVIYTGLRQTPEMVVNTALQEDVDAIGISILSGAHNTVFPKIIQLMKDKGIDDVLLTGGGIIPEEDIAGLQTLGVGQIFHPGTPPARSLIILKIGWPLTDVKLVTHGTYFSFFAYYTPCLGKRVC
jgi:methylmalonyl-CoA mutase C-terminal domain/subunit